VCLVVAFSWGELSGTFTSLVRDAQWQVRRTLSFSLHELARILGPDLAEKELLGTFDLLLHDLDEVGTSRHARTARTHAVTPILLAAML
jgi:serine/threonine-protein phosphatase 4 regulatory subunit 1